MWCSGQRHKRQSYPAKDFTCNSCRKRGHFQAVCLSKKHRAKRTSINEVVALKEVEIPFLCEFYSCEADFWTAFVKVDGHKTHFKLDTGAAVSIVSDEEPWLKAHQLMILQQILRGPGGTILSIVGTFRATLTYKECQISETVFVLKDQFYYLLSKKACVDLGLIARIGEVNTSKFHWRISSVFQWSGKTGNQISDQAQPRCNASLHLHPGKVPHPLLP